jgi:hypothetical protein
MFVNFFATVGGRTEENWGGAGINWRGVSVDWGAASVVTSCHPFENRIGNFF